MNAVLLDPLTGRPEGETSAPRLHEDVEDYLDRLERRAALERNRRLLSDARTAPGVVAATTTNRYLSVPAAAAGISRASSGGAAWSFSAYTEIVAVNSITVTYYIAGFTWCWPTPAAVVDTTYEVLFEIATGAAAAEVLAIQIPASWRADTLVGYVPSNFYVLPEPKEIAANTRLSVRVAQSLATTSQTYNAIKLLYQRV